MPSESFIGVLPGFQEISLVPGQNSEGTFQIVNPSSDPNSSVNYRITVTPFSVHGDTYDSDFRTETNYTQIKDWITIDEPIGTLSPEEIRDVHFTVNTPVGALGGGQYAAFIVRIEDPVVEKTGYAIVSRNQVATILYASVDGNLKRSGKILKNSIQSFVFDSNINASSTIENTGNIHNNASYVLRVNDYFSDEELYSSSEAPKRNTIVPDTSLSTITSWQETPSLGLFRVTQTISYLDEVNTVTKTVFVCPLWFLLLWLGFLSACIAWFFSRRSARLRIRKNSTDYSGPKISR